MDLASASDIGVTKLAELAGKVMAFDVPAIGALRDPRPRVDTKDLHREISQLIAALAAMQRSPRRITSRGRSL